MKDYLDYPEPYLEFLAEKLNNGCGPGGWKGVLIPDIIYLISIKEACKIHDYEYGIGGYEEDKIEADYRFYMNILKIIKKKSKFSKFLNPLRRKRACLYYGAVSEDGWEYYNYINEEEREAVRIAKASEYASEKAKTPLSKLVSKVKKLYSCSEQNKGVD